MDEETWKTTGQGSCRFWDWHIATSRYSILLPVFLFNRIECEDKEQEEEREETLEVGVVVFASL